ncbi:MAG: DUF4389 domain-containing protein [Gemmatimonadota bacterium]
MTVQLLPATEGRNRLTTAFRVLLAIPHILLVGGHLAFAGMIGWKNDGMSVGSGTGLLGAVAAIAAVISWFFIMLTGMHPDGLWRLTAYYLRWRVRAVAYLTLLRDEYPPFGDGEYPVELVLAEPPESRDRLTVFFRLLITVPHLIALCFLSVAWVFTTFIAWVAILFTGRFPEALYGFAIGMLAWSTRVEAYLLLLRDEYPPFSLRV